MTLGQLICLTREAIGLTLRDVERLSGLSNAFIGQLETGWVDDISLRNAVKLGKALGLSLEQMAATNPRKGSRRESGKAKRRWRHVP
jgi:transcriptional regulator with XRE-family HTH domain